jgi:organic hydroperoxide reductase OsmC/OhrA
MLNLLRRSACGIVVVVWSLAGAHTGRADELVRHAEVVVTTATAAGVALPKGMVKDVEPTTVPEPTALFLAGFSGCMLLVLAQRLGSLRSSRESGL